MKALSFVSWLSVTLALAASHHPSIGCAESPPTPGATPPSPSTSLSLEEAIDAALRHSPGLASLRAEVPASDARTLQAGLWPNPLIDLTVEDFGGSGTREGFEQSQTTLQLVQPIELGGKRSRRREVAVLGRRRLDHQIESRRRELVAEVRKRFVAALLAQEHRALAGEIEALSSEALRLVEIRARAGATAVSERGHVRLLLGRARMDLQRAEREIIAARRQLAAMWGENEPTLTAVGHLEDVAPPPPLGDLLPHLDDNPEVTRWDAEIERRVAGLSLERAKRIPDVTLAAGGRHYSDNDDFAAVVDLSVPLPLFDRNQAGIAEAEHLLVKARAQRDQAHLRARTELLAAYDELHTQFERVAMLGVQVLADAKTANSEILQAYRRGAAGSIDVLAAQRALFELQTEYLDALASYHAALIDVERLTATPISKGEDR